jgi:hypothetical protein
MKALGIQSRFLRLFYFFFILNLCISILNQYPKEYENSFIWFINLLFPVWISISGGSILGLLIFMLPQAETDTLMKLVRSQVIGAMIVTFILFVFYLYGIMAYLFIPA